MRLHSFIRTPACALFALLLVLHPFTARAQALSLATQVAGGEFEYLVRPGDFLIAIGARFGIDPRLLAGDNALADADRIRAGQRLYIRNLHIVPPALSDGLLVNIPQRMLFHMAQGKLVAAYPVGPGKPTWPTPTGEFTVITRERDKTWVVPQSIRDELLALGKPVLTEVPPGPDNPLGAHWIGLDRWGCGIHGTNAPSSVYQFRSHGCIRLHPDDIAGLFARVRVGTPGRLIYQPVMLAWLPDGRILLEVHRDIYARGVVGIGELRALARENGFETAIDWGAVNTLLSAADGVAHEVGRFVPDYPKGHL